MNRKEQEKQEAIAKLREWIKPGDTISTIVRHVSRSGMSRSISLVIAHEGEPFEISYWAARAMGDRIDHNNGGIKIGGCGMDMGFALVYNLSATLFPDGFGCVGEDPENRRTRCPSNDHSNGDRDYTPHSAGKPLYELVEQPGTDCWENPRGHIHWHDSGGYALKQRWL